MPELIDRDAVLAEIREFQIRFNETGDSHERVAYASAEHCMLVIKAAPAVEAEPVRYGRWIQSDALDYKDPNGVIHVHGMCSCCRRIYDFRDMTSRFKFCPNCGAEMRGVSENAES